jgi:hypothetical protein
MGITLDFRDGHATAESDVPIALLSALNRFANVGNKLPSHLKGVKGFGVAGQLGGCPIASIIGVEGRIATMNEGAPVL